MSPWKRRLAHELVIDVKPGPATEIANKNDVIDIDQRRVRAADTVGFDADFRAAFGPNDGH